MSDTDDILDAAREIMEEQAKLDNRVKGFKIAEILRDGKPSMVPADLKDHPGLKSERKPAEKTSDRDDTKWGAGRLTGLAKRLYEEGKSDTDVANELKKHNDDATVRATAQQRGRDQAGV